MKTIPVHFSVSAKQEEEDVNRIFGSEEFGPRYFHIGRPLTWKHPSVWTWKVLSSVGNGIFGKTGTGKTFLTRLVLAGLIHKTAPSTSIFDMQAIRLAGHPGGWWWPRQLVKGLKQLFGSKVAILPSIPTLPADAACRAISS